MAKHEPEGPGPRTPKATRAEVYAAIDTERDYQDNVIAKDPKRHDPASDDAHHSVGAYVTMLHTYAHRLQEAWTSVGGDAAALEMMRKVAGVAVHCMEDHGAPRRVTPPKKAKRTRRQSAPAAAARHRQGKRKAG